ncbi:gamma carbonic anhydrase family protein [uncultured Nocardioides sp.]|uniref:gamma carbonic anhydrase family protein n=1 Tax=uncultured Nocardioides sp. TaxID=198441 RepID=UPI0026391DA8|nr:gamma carbonic anhydrase family protein [uncultured Nocardioides sp.]
MTSAPLLVPLGGHTPVVHPDAWVAPGAVLVGDVRIGAGASVWYGCVLRADVNPIVLGEGSNLQDGTVVHADTRHGVHVGARVSVGHQALVHGCTVGDDVLVGMGSRLLSGCTIGTESLVGAGAVVREGQEVPPRSLVVGVPGKVRRELTEDELARVHRNAESYYALRDAHREATRDL